MKINLTKRQAMLILGVIDYANYDSYSRLWEFVEDEETEKITKKLEKVIDSKRKAKPN